LLAWAVPVLLFLAVGLLAVAAAWPDALGSPRAWLIVAAGAIAPLLIWTSLATADSHGRFGDLRLSVVSLKLAPDAIDGATIGGDRAHDVLLVGDLPAALISLKRLNDRDVGLTVARPPRGEFAGAVAFEPTETPLWQRPFAPTPRFVGERAVRDGEAFCPAGCNSGCRIGLPTNGDRLAIEGDSADLPRMETRGLGVSWGPAQRIYPLRTFASGGGCDEALQGENGLPVTAILFRHGGFDGRLYGLFLDAPAVGSAPDAVLTRGGPALRIHLYRVDYTAGGAAEEHDHPSRIVERRSVTARLDAGGSLIVTLDTPEDIQLPAQAIANVMASKPGDDIVLPIDNDRNSGRPFVGDSTLQFRSLGGQLAETALGRLLLHPDRKTKTLAPWFTVIGGGEVKNVPYGEHFTLGSSYSAEFALERLSRDNGILGLVGIAFLAFAATALLAVTWPQRRASVPVFVLLTLAEVLIAFRVLIAVSGAYVDAGAARAFIVPSALFAYLAVPFLIAQVAGGKRSLLATVAYAVLVGALGFIAARDFGLDKTSWIAGALIVLVVLAGLLAQPAMPQAIRNAIVHLGTRIRTTLAWPYTRLQAQIWYPKQIGRPLIGLGLLVVVRLALLFVGVKEGIPIFGFRVALSTIYLPIALILLARLLAALRSEDTAPTHSHLWRPLLWSVAVALAFATPIAARDTGFIIFALGTAVLGIVALLQRRIDTIGWLAALIGLPLGFLLLCYVLLHSFVVDTTLGFAVSAAAALAAVALGVAAMHASERLARIAPPLPLAALVAAAALLLVPFFVLTDWIDATLIALGAAAVFAVLWQRPVAAWAMPVAFALALGLSFQLPILPSAVLTERSAARALDDQMRKTQNILRIWYSVRPGDVGDFATSSAQNLGAAMAHLHDYGACPASQWPGCLAGHGYLAIPRPTVLAPYHLNDNVTAIHLIAPFGRLGAAAFLLLLAAAALLYTSAVLRDRDAEDPPPLALAGIAALWTVFGAALYMILANLEVLPFTGKNVYFLAAASGSDLLEGAILIAIAMAALKDRRA
jgi:hypothetical protein